VLSIKKPYKQDFVLFAGLFFVQGALL
jgi:hypothetical protein